MGGLDSFPPSPLHPFPVFLYIPQPPFTLHVPSPSAAPRAFFSFRLTWVRVPRAERARLSR
jgi:hypothetical protein